MGDITHITKRYQNGRSNPIAIGGGDGGGEGG